MKKKATMADVAKMAGVSKSTVSQYINNRFNYMSDSTKEKIKDAIESLQYVPNYTAKSLKQKKTKTIGVIIANVLHPFSTEIIRTIEDTCEANDFQLFICNADDNSDKERNYIEILLSKQVDGLIIFPTPGNFNYYNQLKSQKFPIVFVDRGTEENIYPTFLLNNEKASEMVVNHFVENQIYDIGIVLPPLIEGITPRFERLDGYRKALTKRNIPIKEELIIAGTKEEIWEKLEALYKSNQLPRGFYTVNDVSFIKLSEFIKCKRLNVNEFKLITIDDTIYFDILCPPITVIKQPTFEMGKAATEYMLKMINNEVKLKENYQIKRFEPILIER